MEKATQFESLWEAHNLPLRNFIATKVPKEEVLDILQTVFMKLISTQKGDTEIRNVRNWLFQVARNSIADYYKNKTRNTWSAPKSNITWADSFQACVCDITEPMIRLLLPPKYGTPLLLSDIHKVPQREIARQLHLSYENTKSRIQRARKKLKEEIERSVDLNYNDKGQIVGGKLKPKHRFPKELVDLIQKFDLEEG